MCRLGANITFAALIITSLVAVPAGWYGAAAQQSPLQGYVRHFVAPDDAPPATCPVLFGHIAMAEQFQQTQPLECRDHNMPLIAAARAACSACPSNTCNAAVERFNHEKWGCEIVPPTPPATWPERGATTPEQRTQLTGYIEQAEVAANANRTAHPWAAQALQPKIDAMKKTCLYGSVSVTVCNQNIDNYNATSAEIGKKLLDPIFQQADSWLGSHPGVLELVKLGFKSAAKETAKKQGVPEPLMPVVEEIIDMIMEQHQVHMN